MKLFVKGHDNPDVDSIISGYLLAKVLNKLGHEATFVIPGNVQEDIIEICNLFGFDVSQFQDKFLDESANFILVDYYYDTRVNVVGVVDHHVADIDMSNVEYWYEPASSTSCMIGQKYEEYLDRDDISLACLGGFADTASFHSTKARESDLVWIKDMCQKYDLDYKKMYEAGLGLTDISDLDRASLNGIKTYAINNRIVESSFIQVKDLTDEQLNYMLELIKGYVKEYQLELFAFIVHDMKNFRTKVYKVGQSGIEIDEYDKYTSRGNVIIPAIKKILNNKGQ